ncbi:hypothetical protein GCM10023229_15730 [Flavisolibacter ginsenosidimutans]
MICGLFGKSRQAHYKQNWTQDKLVLKQAIVVKVVGEITTDSDHPFYKYPNLIRGLEVRCANLLWVSDITYIALLNNYCYLSLVTDAYSRKIVGYCLFPTLKRTGPLTALSMALAQGVKGRVGGSSTTPTEGCSTVAGSTRVYLPSNELRSP